MELVCPAGNLPALKSAVDAGADVVYVGLNDATNARHFAGLNFTPRRLEQAVRYVRDRRRRLFIAVNTYAGESRRAQWHAAIDRAADLGADAVILADTGLLEYAAAQHPALPRHLSVQASATTPEALAFHVRHFGIRRAVLPRVLALQQIRALAENTDVELEVFGFGSLCIMAEGRCQLSAYATGQSPNLSGVCSPAAHVRWAEHDGDLEARLNGVLIDRFAPHEAAGYPTLCKGRFHAGDRLHHALEEPTSLNTIELLPDLLAYGIRAVKIEGRQRSPAYVAAVTRVWRRALDDLECRGGGFRPDTAAEGELGRLAEGSQTTFGAYRRHWQ